MQVETVRGLARVGVGGEEDPQGADEVAAVLAVVGFEASDQLPERTQFRRTRQPFEHRFQTQKTPSTSKIRSSADRAEILQPRRRTGGRRCRSTGKVHKKTCRARLPALSTRKG